MAMGRTTNLKKILLILSIQVLFVFAGGVLWNYQQEVVALHNDVARLNEENALL